MHGQNNIKFDIAVCFKKLSEKSVSLKSDKNSGYFTWRPMYIYDISPNYSLNEKCFRQNFQIKSKHTFYVQQLFPEYRTVYEKMRKIWYSWADHRQQSNMAHALCMLDKKVYKHTLIISNIYCFSTAAMVTRTRLNVTIYVHYIRVKTIKFLNSPPCVCRGSTGQKPWYGLMTLTYQRFTAVFCYLWRSLSEWHLLLSACVVVCRHENVGAWIRAMNEH